MEAGLFFYIRGEASWTSAGQDRVCLSVDKNYFALLLAPSWITFMLLHYVCLKGTAWKIIQFVSLLPLRTSSTMIKNIYLPWVEVGSGRSQRKQRESSRYYSDVGMQNKYCSKTTDWKARVLWERQGFHNSFLSSVSTSWARPSWFRGFSGDGETSSGVQDTGYFCPEARGRRAVPSWFTPPGILWVNSLRSPLRSLGSPGPTSWSPLGSLLIRTWFYGIGSQPYGLTFRGGRHNSVSNNHYLVL